MNSDQRNKISAATVKLCEFIELEVGLGLHNNSLSILAQIATTIDDYTTDEQGREMDKAEARIREKAHLQHIKNADPINAFSGHGSGVYHHDYK
jgi:hypothetical protein